MGSCLEGFLLNLTATTPAMNLRRVTRKSNSTAPRAARQRRVPQQEVQLGELGKAVNFPLMSVRSGDGIYQQPRCLESR
jgi:hypothetical protein